MNHIRVSFLAATLLVAACSTPPQTSESEMVEADVWPEPHAADVSTLDGLITAYYEVVSGPAGEMRDWERDKSLHVPGALVVITQDGDNTTEIGRMTISDYHARSPGPAQSAFYEVEINREVRQHGSTVHIWSTYEWRSEPDGPVGGNGVNSIEAIWDGSRYWITSWTYDGRSSAPPVPEEYLPGNDE